MTSRAQSPEGDEPVRVGEIASITVNPAGVGSLELVRAFPDLTFSQPILLTAPDDGTDRIFIVEKAGIIKVFPNQPAPTGADVSTFLDIRSLVEGNGEQGLLGLAFDPDFATNGYFFVYYSAVNPRRSVIARFRVSGDPDAADPASRLIVLEVAQPDRTNHKAGMIAFGLDDMLYIAVGDGGGGGDPDNLAQDTSNMLGALLRIDPSTASQPANPYAVPADNPLSGNGTRACGLNGYSGSDACREIFGYGLRNPWRFSVDRVTGDIWIGDVGQGTIEEVDFIPAGLRDLQNFGWRIFEGTLNHNNPNNVPLNSTVAPVHQYAHDSVGGRSITGGYAYRGAGMPSFVGRYIYGDFVSGRIWALEYDGTNVVSNVQVASLGSVSSFGEDQHGELYAVSLSGTIHIFREDFLLLAPTNVRIVQ